MGHVPAPAPALSRRTQTHMHTHTYTHTPRHLTEHPTPTHRHKTGGPSAPPHPPPNTHTLRGPHTARTRRAHDVHTHTQLLCRLCPPLPACPHWWFREHSQAPHHLCDGIKKRHHPQSARLRHKRAHGGSSRNGPVERARIMERSHQVGHVPRDNDRPRGGDTGGVGRRQGVFGVPHLEPCTDGSAASAVA